MEDNLQSLKEKLNNKLKDSSYFYLCNDPERALGLEEIIPNYHIVHIDLSQYLDDLQSKGIKYYCWQEHLSHAVGYRSSIKLIRSSEFLEYFKQNSTQTNYIQTFKISPAFFKKVKELSAILVNTSSDLNRLFEDKLSQFNELQKLNISLPKGRSAYLGEMDHDTLSKEYGDKYVIQFNKGHTGSGTKFIEYEQQLIELKKDFPDRMVKVSEFIEGAPYTLNATVSSEGIFLGGLSRQITGIEALTPYLGATIGNDFTYREDLVQGVEKIKEEAVIIGKAMRDKGYLGLFGLDLIVLPDGSFKIIEINARQPASIPMYTKMQLERGEIPLSLIHIAQFLGIEFNIDEGKYNDMGLSAYDHSQIFVRSFKEYMLEFPLRSGVYRLQGDNAAIDRVSSVVRPDTIFLDEEKDKPLTFQKDGYSIDDIKQGGLLILTPAKGRYLKVNDELGRMQIKGSAYLDHDRLHSYIIDSLIAIKNYQN